MAQPVVPEAGTGSTGPGAELERRAGRSRGGGTWTAWGSDGGGYSVSRGALAVLGSTPPWVTLRLERSESVRRCLAPAAPFRVLVLPARHQLGSSCRRSGRSGGAVLRCRRDNGSRCRQTPVESPSPAIGRTSCSFATRACYQTRVRHRGERHLSSSTCCAPARAKRRSRRLWDLPLGACGPTPSRGPRRPSASGVLWRTR